MKFLCPNCKAKYQIADEKVSGRTLKMDCRRCGHTITLKSDGEGASAEAASSPPATPTARAAPPRPTTEARPRPAAPSREIGTREASGVGAPPARKTGAALPRTATAAGTRAPAGRASSSAPGASAIGADFRRNVGALSSSHAEPPRATPLDQWHVAINDVPVGPMRRDEIARKIAAGAVTGDSLSWREGYDDWRPLKEIPELFGLLRRATSEAPPKPAPPRSTTGAAPRPPPRPTGALPAATRAPGRPAPPPATRAQPAAPAARSNVVPIGGRLGAAAAPAIGEPDDFDGMPTRLAEGEPAIAERVSATELTPSSAGGLSARTSTPAPAPSSPKAAPEGATTAKSRSSVPAPAPTASAEAPSSELAVGALATSESRDEAAPKRESRRGLPVGAWMGIAGSTAFGLMLAYTLGTRLFPPAPVATTQEVQVVEAPTPTPSEAQVEAEVPAPEGPSETPSATEANHGPARPRGPTKRAETSAPATPQPAGNSAFDRFADNGAGIATISNVPREGGDRPVQRTSELSDDQVRTVVQRGQRALQSCYELAVRGAREAPTVRLDVEVTIAPAGNVTRVNTRGVGPGTMNECVEQSVRRWRFPASGSGAVVPFPVVFQGR